MKAPFNGSAVRARYPVNRAPQNKDRAPRLAAHHVPLPANAKAQVPAASVPRSASAKPGHTAPQATSRSAVDCDSGRSVAAGIALACAAQTFQEIDEIAQ